MPTTRACHLRIQAAVQKLLGSVCARCGHSDYRVLQVDHIHRAREPKGHTLRSGLGLYRAIIRGDKDINDFQLLCANCNFLKKLENKEHHPVHKIEIQFNFPQGVTCPT